VPVSKDPITYWRAAEVRAIADELIPQFHAHIDEMEVRFIFKSKAGTSRGGHDWAYVRKVGGLTAYLARASELESITGPRPPAPVAEPFFLMVVSHDVWTRLDGAQRIALIDHELCHICPDGELRPHPVEEFPEVVRRHGVKWRPNLEELVEAAQQAPLFEQPHRDGAELALPVH
jgi:predicted metallopeptidase